VVDAEPHVPATSKFPAVIWQNGRGYILRGDLEAYKAQLILTASGGRGPIELTRSEYDTLVPLKRAAAELGYGRRTLGRRIAKSGQKAAQ
jgi:hypothetical protein